MGEFETLNFLIGVLPEDVAILHALYRTSIKGRKDLVNMLFSNNGEGVYKMDKTYTSRVVEIFLVTLKSLGISLEFIDEDEEVQILNNEEVREHTLNGAKYLCTDYQFWILKRISAIREQVLIENPILTNSELDRLVEKRLNEMKFLNGEYKEDLGDLDLLVEKENEITHQKLLERKLKEESEEIAETLEEIQEVDINDTFGDEEE